MLCDPPPSLVWPSNPIDLFDGRLFVASYLSRVLLFQHTMLVVSHCRYSPGNYLVLPTNPANQQQEAQGSQAEVTLVTACRGTAYAGFPTEKARQYKTGQDSNMMEDGRMVIHDPSVFTTCCVATQQQGAGHQGRYPCPIGHRPFLRLKVQPLFG